MWRLAQVTQAPLGRRLQSAGGAAVVGAAVGVFLVVGAAVEVAVVVGVADVMVAGVDVVTVVRVVLAVVVVVLEEEDRGVGPGTAAKKPVLQWDYWPCGQVRNKEL